MPREEIIGEDVGNDQENIIGALSQALMRRPGVGPQAARGRSVSRPQFSSAQLATQVGGSKDTSLRAPLGMGAVTFVVGGPTTIKQVVEPQEAFRGERLVLDVSALPDGNLVAVESIFVGSLPQTPSQEFNMPLSMFRPDATDAQMDWQICPAGTKIQVTVTLLGPALADADTVTVSMGIYGVWIRG
jgi:hypothetical protein